MEKRRHKRLDLECLGRAGTARGRRGNNISFYARGRDGYFQERYRVYQHKGACRGNLLRCEDTGSWTGEIICAAIEIVRRAKYPDDYRYGCRFTGMSDEDAVKIDVYQIFHDI